MDGGDARACDRLFKRLHPVAVLAARKYVFTEIDAEDVAARAMADCFTPAEARGDVINVAAYLRGIVRNRAFDHITAHRRRRERESPQKADFFRGVSVEYLAEDRLAEGSDARYRSLHLAIDQLIPSQRECIRLFYFGDLSYNEIVSETGLSLRKVKSQLQNGKKRLRNILDAR